MGSKAHCERIGAYCALLAARVGADADAFRIAGRLHDVGMIAVECPPGPLSDEQRRLMQTHTTLGQVMLAGSGTPILDLAAEIALTHHERHDGGGYPRGLGGDAIPLAGRITAVADAFDALTTDRPYRRATSVEAAFAVLQAERGRHFDPALVDAFLEQADAVRAVLAQWPDAPASDEAELEPLMTLRDAAATLGVPTSRLRRWADDERIASVRTRGGHRRFPRSAVEQLASASGGKTTSVRQMPPPDGALERAAAVLERRGPALAERAAGTVYRDGPVGWLGTPAARDALDGWLGALQLACTSGDYKPALDADAVLVRQAEAHAATVLELHVHLDVFGRLLLHLLSEEQAPTEQLAGARQLVVALQHARLAAKDAPPGTPPRSQAAAARP